MAQDPDIDAQQAAAAAAAAQGGGGGGGGGSVTPPGAGLTPNAPLYILNAKKKISNVINPYGYFTDMSEKDQRSRYKDAVTPADGFKPLDVNVANSKSIIELLVDLAVTFRWYRFLRIPVEGDGTIDANPKMSPSGKTAVMNVAFTEHKHLLEEYQHITLDQVMAFVAWFMGDANQKRQKHANEKDMLMQPIDPNAAGNAGTTDLFKQSCRIVSQIIWHTIKNHITPTSYRSFLVHKKQFMYTCAETGEVYFEGFTLLKMVLSVVKPDIVIDVKDLENKMKSITILKADNNFRTLCTFLEELQQEINAQKGEDYLKDDTLLTELFRAAEATKNEKFAGIVDNHKTQWITGKITDKNTIIQDLDKIYRNMVAEGSWGKTSDKDAKILALTTQYEKSKSRMAELEGRIKKLSDGKSVSFKEKEGTTKSKKNWQFTKVDKYATHPETGAKYVWCDDHGKGAYMPHPHNHDEWFKKRQAKRNAKGKDGTGNGHRDKRQRQEGKDDGKVVNKLQLGNSLRATLVTRCSMTPADADKLFLDA